MSPYFSVILPVYNVEKYLDRCVQSVLEQDFLNYEVILVNDGSTDQSPRLCDEYLKQYDCVRVIHKENGGLSSARNAGLEQARGEYVLWFDSDDWIEKNTLSLIYSAMDKQEADIVKFNYFRHVDEAVPCYSNAKPGWYTETNNLRQLIDLAFCSADKYSLSACMHAYNREFLINNGLNFQSEREVGSEDFLFNIKALLSAKSILVLREPLYHYDLRVGSLTQRYREKLPEKYTRLYLYLKEYLKKHGKDEQYHRKLSYFYVWFLIYGTCLVNEYNVTESHSVDEGRKRVKEFMRLSEFQQAIDNCETREMSWKQRMQMYALKFRVEALFYWLFVTKPRRG